MNPQTKLIDYSVPIPTEDGTGIAECVAIQVQVSWDEDIQEYVLTPEAREQIEDTQARHMGLMLPTELKSLREKFGLTQAQIGDLLRIGEKSWTRWETGRQRPSRSTNVILKMLKLGIVTPQALQAVHAPWSQPQRWENLPPARRYRDILLAAHRPTAPCTEPMPLAA